MSVAIAAIRTVMEQIVHVVQSLWRFFVVCSNWFAWELSAHVRFAYVVWVLHSRLFTLLVCISPCNFWPVAPAVS